MNTTNQQTVAVTEIKADSGLELLSQSESALLSADSQGKSYELFKKCVLAVLNSAEPNDDPTHINEQLEHFEIEVLQLNKGVKLRVHNAPESAFVDGVMIRGLKEHVFSVLRDIIFLQQEMAHNNLVDFMDTEQSSNAIYHILRNARALKAHAEPSLVVCWGGHAIPEHEYQYTKEVGYRLGLRSLSIITGCGIGAMKGPMKGALIAHSKQRIHDGRYIGITEPGIIAAESPNPIVNELIIMPDIEKRLEAFVRLGHGIVVFPGGVGTAEEILYILAILLHEKNAHIPFPLIFTGPKESAGYFEAIDAFIGATLGKEAQEKYQIIIDDPIAVAKAMNQGLSDVRENRKLTQDAYHYNWQLAIDWELQQPFIPTHEAMAKLQLDKNQSLFNLASNLRKAFSGIVAGNVKDFGMQAVAEHGVYEITGDPELMKQLDLLLHDFVAQKRMKLNHHEYVPCYRVINS